MKLCVVTATTDPERAKPCIRSWGGMPFVGVVNGRPWDPKPKPEGEAEGELVRSWLLSPEYMGTVPAFRLGVDYALDQTDAEIIACLHDDVEIHDPDWIAKTIRLFERHPACGLAGFGGAIGLGDSDIYQKPYNPMQLARIGFRSNLVDAEVHGMRSLLSERVACLDGFSQIGRREFWKGERVGYDITDGSGPFWMFTEEPKRPFTYLEENGLVHHFYDGALGALAARNGWQCWYLPIATKHYGGATAVADQGYQKWAATQNPDGDMGFWAESHRKGYELFRSELPIRV